jgi:hypothetical protein
MPHSREAPPLYFVLASPCQLYLFYVALHVNGIEQIRRDEKKMRRQQSLSTIAQIMLKLNIKQRYTCSNGTLNHLKSVLN